MKRILVVLLVLSVMGGAFAQQQSGWGTLSGEAGLYTRLDFAQPAGEIDGTTMNGNFFDDVNDFWFEATWTRAFGPWNVILPLRLERTYFGTAYDQDADSNDDKGEGLLFDAWNYGDTKAKVEYTALNGNLKVTMPFFFEFSNYETIPYTGANARNDDNDPLQNGGTLLTAGTEPGTGYAYNDGALVGFIPMSAGNVALGAEYNDGNFGFKIGFEDLLTNPKISKAGGFYHFMGGKSQLYVSRGAYETKWWRASSYVLEPKYNMNLVPGSAGFDDNYDSDPSKFHSSTNLLPFHWENINDNGIAYRFFLMDTLNIGISFASAGDYSKYNAGPFYSGDNRWGNGSGPSTSANAGDNYPIADADRKNNTLIYDFLKHPVFGVMYDNGQLGVSAMVGLEPNSSTDYEVTPYNYHNFLGSTTEVGNDDMAILVHIGAYFNLTEQFKINGDISAAFGMDNNLFNAGVEASYNGDPLWAGLGVRAIDVLNDQGFMWGIDYAVGFNNVRDGYGWDDEGNGPWAGLYGHLNGLMRKDADMRLDLGLFFDAGYKNLALTDRINFSITAGMGLELLFQGDDFTGDDKIAFKFNVKPELDWTVFSNGSIHFIYELGSSDLIGDKDPQIDTNQFTTKFKWWL